MFSSFSGNLSGMTGWIQENSKKAASTLQKSVTEISTGMTEMMAENPGNKMEFLKEEPIKIFLAEKETPAGDGNEPEGTTEGVKVETAQTEIVPNAINKNEVLNQVTAKFTNDVSKVWGSALSFGKDVYSKVFFCLLMQWVYFDLFRSSLLKLLNPHQKKSSKQPNPEQN